MAISQTSNKLILKPINLINLFTTTTTTTTTTATSFASPPPSSECMMEENIKTAERIIHKWNIDRHSHSKFASIFHENNKEAKVFIDCVKRLHRAMLFLASHHSKSDNLTVAQRLMQIAMKRLQKEFHLILTDNHQHLEPESAAILSPSIIGTEEQQKMHVSLCKQPSAIAVSNLWLIADAMISCGYSKECISMYKTVRKSTINEALFHLGIQPYTQSHVKSMTNASHFDNHVKIWLKAVQIAVKTLFNSEKFLCEHVFASHAAIRDLCFEKSTKEEALNLFMFPQLLATRCNKLKSDTVFVLIDLYNSISDLWPEIESIFSNESVSSVKIQALSSLHTLSSSIRTFIDNFHSSIQKNSSKLTVSGGGIHPLNNSVMTYLSSLADYSNSSTALTDDLQRKQHSLFVTSYLDSLNTDEKSHVAVSATFECIIVMLLCKLDMKSKSHNYAALSYLFLANNLHFIIEKVRVTNLKLLLGDEWIAKHEKKLKEYVSSYQLMSWNKVFLCLPENATLSPEEVRDCFRRLCSTFEEVYAKQTSWIVVDEKMREEMKALIANKLVPAYGAFYAKHLMTLSGDERCMRMLTRLSPENMEKYLSGLFLGTSTILRCSQSPHASWIVNVTRFLSLSVMQENTVTRWWLNVPHVRGVLLS
ncbi:putative exocyst complex component Exo70, cullin repeat-like-containing domain superfamily [Helianthus debilis subsp. tardiflorus]